MLFQVREDELGLRRMCRPSVLRVRELAKKARHLSSIFRARALFAKALTRQQLEGAHIRFTPCCTKAKMHHFFSWKAVFITASTVWVPTVPRKLAAKNMHFKTHRCTIHN